MIIKDQLLTKKKNLLFDIDGTLVYYDTLKDLINEALLFYGFDPKDEYHKMQANGVIKSLNYEQVQNKFNLEFLIDCWEESLLFLKNSNVSAKEFGLKMIELEKKYVKEIPNTRNALKELKNLKYRLLCSTNWLEKAQKDKLKQVKIKDYFLKIYSCEENNYIKPDPRHFYNILDQEGFYMKDTIMIGDSSTDILCKNIGMDTVLYDQNKTKEKIYDNATVVITDIKDLTRVLKK